MDLSNSFDEFIKQIAVSNVENISKRFQKITKRLNADFHNLSSDSDSNSLVVGSLGRGTAINGISILDMIFEMPMDLYKKYNEYKGNGSQRFFKL